MEMSAINNQSVLQKSRESMNVTRRNTSAKEIELCIMVGIFVISMLARLIKLLVDPVLLRDAALYLEIAEQINKSNNYLQTSSSDIIIPPLPNVALRFLIGFGFSSEIAGRSLSVFLGSLIPVIGYSIISKIVNSSKAKIICIIIFIFHPTLVSYSIQPLRENYYLFFFGLTIITALNAIQMKKNIDWAVCGAMSALAFLCRYEALETLIIYPVFLLILLIKRLISLRLLVLQASMYCTAFFITLFVFIALIQFDISFIVKISFYSNEMLNDNSIIEYLNYEDTKIDK